MIPAGIEDVIKESDDVRLRCIAARLYSLPAPVQRAIGELIATRLRIGGLANRVVPLHEFGIVDTALRIAELSAGREMPAASCSTTCSRATCAKASAL